MEISFLDVWKLEMGFLWRHCRFGGWVWPTCCCYHSVCCQCISPRHENSLLALHAWLTQIHHNESVSLGRPSFLFVSVCVGVCEKAQETREWWTRSDIRPLKQPKINGLNRRAPLEGCGWVIRTSRSHCASIYLPFWTHTLLHLELPDVEPHVKKEQRQRRFF